MKPRHARKPKPEPVRTELQPFIRRVARDGRKLHVDYHQLKYVFREVRRELELEVPKKTGRALYQLPTAEEVAAFYAVIADPIHRLLFNTLELTGMRVSELCSMEVDKLDLKKNEAFVLEAKGKKDRIVILPPRLCEKLAIHLDGKNQRYVFESNRNSSFTTRRIHQITVYYKEKAGITKDLSPHTFRHLWNTRLAEAGIPEEKRMILAGHSSKKTQEIYTHLGVGGIKDEVMGIWERMGK